jgi:hypothetical protein
MTTLIRLAVRLYPAWWRRRYGREFDALLADLSPGWRDLFDVTLGALTMRLHSLATVPVACALAGALVGTIIAFRSPTVYAASATLSLGAAPAGTAQRSDLHVPIDNVLKAAGASPRTTRVMVLHSTENDGGTLLRLTYADPRPERAKAVADGLADAVVRHHVDRTPRVIAAPSLPTSPERPPYATAIGGGTIAGMAIGAAALVTLRVRRRRS